MVVLVGAVPAVGVDVHTDWREEMDGLVGGRSRKGWAEPCRTSSLQLSDRSKKSVDTLLLTVTWESSTFSGVNGQLRTGSVVKAARM